MLCKWISKSIIGKCLEEHLKIPEDHQNLWKIREEIDYTLFEMSEQ